MTDWMDEEMRKLKGDFGEKTLERSDRPFEDLLVSIINQQLSTHSAEAIRKRFFEKFERTPEAILEAEKDEMNEVGLSSQKIDYMKSAAEHFLEDDLSAEKFSDMSDEEVIDELTDIHGIGVWTAKMFLITVLGREDIFPVEDLGIRKAMENIYSLESRDEMRSKASEWEPYRSLASLYLWESLD